MGSGLYRDPGELVDSGGIAGAKALAAKLDPAAARALIDHFRNLERQLNVLIETYVKVRGRLESWEAEPGDLARQAISSLINHTNLTLAYISSFRALIEEVSASAWQTSTRMIELPDELIEYTPQIRMANAIALTEARDLIQEFFNTCFSGTARLKAALADVGGLPATARPRASLLASPYPTSSPASQEAASAGDETKAAQPALTRLQAARPEPGMRTSQGAVPPPIGVPSMAVESMLAAAAGFTLVGGVFEESAPTAAMSTSQPTRLRGSSGNAATDAGGGRTGGSPTHPGHSVPEWLEDGENCPTCGTEFGRGPRPAGGRWNPPVIGVDESGLFVREAEQTVLSVFEYKRDRDT